MRSILNEMSRREIHVFGVQKIEMEIQICKLLQNLDKITKGGPREWKQVKVKACAFGNSSKNRVSGRTSKGTSTAKEGHVRPKENQNSMQSKRREPPILCSGADTLLLTGMSNGKVSWNGNSNQTVAVSERN